MAATSSARTVRRVLLGTVRHAAPLFGGRLGRPNVHAPVHEHRVDAHDLRTERLGHRAGGLGLPRRGRANHSKKGSHGHAEAALTGTGASAPCPMISPSRKCGWAPVMKASTNVPGL